MILIVADSVSGKFGTSTIGTIQAQYQAWANADAIDSDGVANGLAFLLGATAPGVNALNKLSAAAEAAASPIKRTNGASNRRSKIINEPRMDTDRKRRAAMRHSA